MLDERRANISVATLNLTEDARMQFTSLDRRINSLGDEVGNTGVSRVALDHNRAACSQCRGRIATRG